MNKNLNVSIVDQYCSKDGRSIFLNIELHDMYYTIINLYAPNDELTRNSFFKRQIDLIQNFKSGSLLIGGDFNEVLNTIDRISKSKAVASIKSTYGLKQLVKQFKLDDIWRVKNKNKLHFTWRKKTIGRYSRIDYFLVDKELEVVNCDIRPAQIMFTDHNAVALKIKSDIKNDRGPGMWKMNNAVLSNEDFCNQLIQMLRKLEQSNEFNVLDKRKIWDLFKVSIKQLTIDFCKNKSKSATNEIKKLESELKLELEANVDTIKINKLEQSLNQLYAEKATGAQVRSRINWVENGEQKY